MDARDEDGSDSLPKALHSAQTGTTFCACSACGAPLGQGELIPHAITKVWRGGEVVFECALCATCIAGLWSEFSEESKERIAEAALLEERLPRITAFGEEPAHCASCGEAFDPSDEQAERCLLAIVLSTNLLEPMTGICGACNERVEELLSQKTRETLEDFQTRTFPGVGADVDWPAYLFGSH